MEMLKNLVKGPQPEKHSPDKAPQTNRTMVVPSNVEPRRYTKFSKEDPGPRRDRFVSHKKTIAKTVAENKKRVDERGKFFSPSKTEKIFKDREGNEVEYFELNPEELLEDSKSPDKEYCNIIKEAIFYLHKKGGMIQKLKEKEEMLRFPIKVDTKEESELVDHLNKALEKQTIETKRLQEEIQVLIKGKNKAEEDLAKSVLDSDTKAKKIAELNYTIRVNNIKMQECQKKLKQQIKIIEELKKMNDNEQMKCMRDISSLKKEQANLLKLIEEKETEIKRLKRENEELNKKHPLVPEKKKALSKSFSYNPDEIINAVIESNISFHSIIECSNACFSLHLGC